MRIACMSVFLLTNLILQSTLFRHIEIIGIRPNTAVVLIVCYAMLRGDVEGAIFGFFAGLLQDIVFGRIIGLYAMLGLLTGYFCGKPFKDFYRENYLLPIFLISMAVITYEFFFYLLTFLFQGHVDLLFYFWRIMLPTMAYSTLLAIPLYRLVYAVNSAVEKYEKKNRKLF